MAESRRLEVHRPSEPVNTLAKAADSKVGPACRICKKDHPLRKCYRFKRMSIDERINTVKKLKYCFNCFSTTHILRNCDSRDRCTECLDEHHTMLHRFRRQQNEHALARRPQRPKVSQNAVKPNKSRYKNKKRQHQTHQQQHQKKHYTELSTQHQRLQQFKDYHGNPSGQPATIIINVHSGHIN